MSYSAVVGQLRDRLGVYALGTVQGVANYHDPATFPRKPDIVQIAAMADIYGLKLGDLSEPISDALEVIRDSLRRGAWSGTPV